MGSPDSSSDIHAPSTSKNTSGIISKDGNIVSLHAPCPSSGSISGDHTGKVLIDAERGVDCPQTATVEEIEAQKKGRFAYVLTWYFWLVFVSGQILSLCVTGTNTLSTLLSNAGTSIPAFQTLFNYVILNIIFTSYTIYCYGLKDWGKLLYRRGWKYFIFAFFDVEGNYFTVLAYRYTTVLSAQLINFWAIVIVIVISFVILHVRYHWFQISGILMCCAGMGILLASDYMTGSNSWYVTKGNQIKGDVFAIIGATFYGLSNITQEFLVSKQPLYEVVGQLGFWAMFINGVQAAIFDRNSFHNATWNGAVAGYIAGYTLCLVIFYSLTPVLFRMSSAAFLNISLLTANFWGVIIGLKVFHYHVHYLYPIAFCLIMVGHVVYYCGKKVLGEAVKPWLGKNQERGVSGIGTAKRKAANPNTLI